MSPTAVFSFDCSLRFSSRPLWHLSFGYFPVKIVKSQNLYSLLIVCAFRTTQLWHQVPHTSSSPHKFPTGVAPLTQLSNCPPSRCTKSSDSILQFLHLLLHRLVGNYDSFASKQITFVVLLLPFIYNALCFISAHYYLLVCKLLIFN